MLKIIQFLWHGCWHDWEFTREIAYYGDRWGNTAKLPTRFAREMICKKCGRGTEFRIK